MKTIETPPPASLPPVWTTPQILKTGLVAIWVTSLLLMLAAILGARSHRRAMQIVGRDAARGAVSAQRIEVALADMDAGAADELLSQADAASARRVFERQRAEATSAIVAAAENITRGDAERRPIQTLALGLETYTAQIQSARDFRESGNKTFLVPWRDAVSFMDKTLMPAARALDETSQRALTDTYLGRSGPSIQALIWLLTAGLAVIVVLLLLQIFLASRMRRVLNPVLFLATLTALIFVIYSGQRFTASDRDLKIAKEDAFDSIHALMETRSRAYLAEADENRALLDPGQRGVFAGRFQTDMAAVASWPENATEPDTLNSKGLLALELRNITFAGEQQAASDTVVCFFNFRNIERQIQALDLRGHHDEALALELGTGGSQAAGALDRFDGALGRTLDINRRAFDDAVERGFRDVEGLEIGAPVTALLISLLGWVGLRPRIREYES